MSLLSKERSVSDFGQLERYLSKHRGSVDGTLLITSEDGEGSWQDIVEGKFVKVETGPEAITADEIRIEFRPGKNEDTGLTHTVDAASFALGSVSVLSRHSL